MVAPDNYSESIVLDARKGDLAAIRLALRHDPDIPAWQRIKGTALCEAASLGHLEIVRLLLEHKAPLGGNRTPNQFTPLHCAVATGQVESVRLLLTNKPPLEAHSENGHTPLTLAARKCNLPILKLILDAGAKLETPGNQDHTALCVAVHARQTACISELLRRGASSTVVAYGIGESGATTTPLIAAVAAGSSEAVKALLDGGVDPNYVDRYQTALFAAVERGPELVKLLLAAKAEPNRIDEEGRTPLSYAAEAGKKEVVELLLAAKADPTLADKSERTPLLHAALHHKKEAAMALLAAGADPLLVSKERQRAIDFLLEDLKTAPELRPLLAKYLNNKGLPIKAIPPMPRGAGKSGERCIEHADCDFKAQLGCMPDANAKKPFTGACYPMPANQRKLRAN